MIERNGKKQQQQQQQQQQYDKQPIFLFLKQKHEIEHIREHQCKHKLFHAL